MPTRESVRVTVADRAACTLAIAVMVGASTLAWSQSDDMPVPLSRTSSGLLTVPVRVGKETYTFLLDTGSATTVISERVARVAKLQTYGGVRMMGSAGSKDVRQGWLGQLRVGQLTLTNHWVVIADVATIDRQLDSIDGILGTDVLTKGRMRLDLADGKLWLLP